MEQRPDGGIAAKRLRERWAKTLEYYEPKLMLSRHTDAMRVRTVVDCGSMLVLRAVFTGVFVSMLGL